MDTLGTEIGQKMRSAVKAKLIELGTGSGTGYIDDELPDYVMIMVANKRSRQQMVDDLSLFLGAQTEIFVNWLHQVLQKLQEVTLPATAATKSKESTKRKSSEVEDKKKDKKRKDKKTKRRDRSTDGEEAAEVSNRMSGTEDNTPPRPAVVLPATSITEVFAHQYIEKAKKSLESDSIPVAKKTPAERSESRDRLKSKTPPTASEERSVPSIVDIASASVVQKHHKELCELKEIEERISAAKRHLRSLGTDISDEDSEDLLLLKANEDDLLLSRARSDEASSTRSTKPSQSTVSKQRQRITMGPAEPSKQAPPAQSTAPLAASRSTDTQQANAKKRSVLERLGTKKPSITAEREKAVNLDTRTTREPTTKDVNKSSDAANSGASGTKSTIISLSAHRREEREIYVPLFRRKEASQEQSAPKNRVRQEGTMKGDNRQRERSRERNIRETRSPVSRLPPSHSRNDTNRARSRESNFRRLERDRVERVDDQSMGRKSRPRERSRSREWTRDNNRERSGSGGHVNNGTDTVRGRIGSRVIVLPPKPEYNEDVIEVPVASVIKVQPRPIVPKAKQPSKNLLLKAMAEAQRSTVANLKKTIDNTRDGSGLHRTDMKRKLVIEISGVANSNLAVDAQYERVPITHYTAHEAEAFNELTEEVDHDQQEEEEEVHEVDITNQVLMEDCDVDEEFKEILQNEYDGPQPSATQNYQMEVTEEDAPSTEQEAATNESKDTKFVVTLDGAFKSSVDREVSPSHTPPPPPVAVPSEQTKGRMSVKDRIGFKVSSRESATISPNPKDSKEMEETLKKRKERFSEKLVTAPATVKPASKSSPTATSNSTSRAAAPSYGNNSSSSRANRSPKSNSRSTQSHSSSRRRTSSVSPERAPRPKNTSSTESRSKRTETTRNVSSSPNQLNELLLQRTKELMDDSVSSSPIYMSKSDYDKMEPSSRKRKRVSPIQFDLTDEDERHDSDDDYHHHHHRDRRARSREEHRQQHRSPSRDSDERSSTRKESRREWEREGEGRESRDTRLKSPGRKIKKLESSRKFDDIPPLLSAVSLSGVEGKSNKLVSGGALKERCKYFPICRQGDACEFLHPTTPCKAFPSCKFGDKCLYLHPMCKYDQTCHWLDCNFMHTKSASTGTSSGLSAPPLASSVVPVQNYKSIIAKPLPPVCKFYPNCVNNQCQYLHPKMCRFGKHCVNKIECNFYHYDIPTKDLHDASSKDKFRWISPFSA
ncbi:zinc finger CCCH domain-containing protein 13 [Anopheles marshallii]|uniref:zinc finger CCCH domain-containing protein 13 n=1 Tax=Anopheles marshallii TaxID=1521116 RepID=UPI00237B5210|nr:zinc finger CCCH domain-containing protein 13 [Anopheles marshallii]